jgi:hypothetical protein
VEDSAVSARSDRQFSPHSFHNDSTHCELETYPELELVLSLAISTVATAFDPDGSLAAGDLQAMERAAVQAMVEHYAPLAAAARRLAASTEWADPTSTEAPSSGAADVLALTPPAAERTAAVAASVVEQPVAIAVSPQAATDVAALAAELEGLHAALSLEAIAIDSCYRLALEAATSTARKAGTEAALIDVQIEA